MASLGLYGKPAQKGAPWNVYRVVGLMGGEEEVERLSALLGVTRSPPPGCDEGVWIGPKAGSRPPWSTSMMEILKGASFVLQDIVPLKWYPASHPPSSFDTLLEEEWPAGASPAPPEPLVKDDEILAIDGAQADSEHCRHHFFKGKLRFRGETQASLWERVGRPLACAPAKDVTVLAFCDNASAIQGFDGRHFCLTAETHNYPSAIAPFPGGATGTGGRIRDVQGCGRGAEPLMALVGYCVAGEGENGKWPQVADPLDILLDGSTGAYDYGNKFGEPTTGGFVRIAPMTTFPDASKRTWLKPIMFTAGIGSLTQENLLKKDLAKGDVLIKLGGPVYRVGIGGGAASSKSSVTKRTDPANQAAVQRGDPAVQEKMNRVIRRLTAMKPNPILAIHDQGAGGNANVLRELVGSLGADIDLATLTLGDTSLSWAEVWIAEYQESNAIACHPQDLEKILDVCLEENVDMVVVGMIRGDGRLLVKNGEDVLIDVFVGLEESEPEKHAVFEMALPVSKVAPWPTLGISYEMFRLILSHGDVGSKAFMTSKVDRSVGGRIACQATLGPLLLPLANCSVAVLPSDSPLEFRGVATAIGEQPFKGLEDTRLLGIYSLSEMMLNLVWAGVDREKIRCSANWMWPCPDKDPEEAFKMAAAMDGLVEGCKTLGIAVDGGKDSLSMKVGPVKAPPSLVLTAYATVEDIRRRVAPCAQGGHLLVLIQPKESHIHPSINLGGSLASRILNNSTHLGDAPHFPIEAICHIFDFVTHYLDEIYAGHDRSDGGLWTTIVEMLIGGGVGAKINVPRRDLELFLFNELPGVVVEVSHLTYRDMLIAAARGEADKWLDLVVLGHTLSANDPLTINDTSWDLSTLREWWHGPTERYDGAQINPKCAKEEAQAISQGEWPKTSSPGFKGPVVPYLTLPGAPKVLIVREEGSNGDRELASAFHFAGFSTTVIQTKDLARRSLDQVSGLAFCGGFSFSDVGGAAFGWASRILSSPAIMENLSRFYAREDTFSLGICNGCQLMIRLGEMTGIRGVKAIEGNTSGRFESRWVTLGVHERANESMWFKGMDGWRLGCWSAHGEGRFVKDGTCVPRSALAYVGPDGDPTASYPFNPNGSPDGLAAVLSSNGRHLAMMPHPERSILGWMDPTASKANPSALYTPWIRLFRNAFRWVSSDTRHRHQVFVVGTGCREAALASKLFESPQVYSVQVGSKERLERVFDDDLSMVVVGPEAPLMEGIINDVTRRGLLGVGPSRIASLYEGSKLFTKEEVKHYCIPVAPYRILASLDEVEEVIDGGWDEWVIKLDGLAQGKGVVLADSLEEWRDRRPTLEAFYPKASPVFVEKRLKGREVSILAFCDGKTMLPMPPVCDYKRRFDYDQGPNTGGMGAVAFGPGHFPALLPPYLLKEIHNMMARFVAESHYSGFLYMGWLIDENAVPWLLEINVRMGDPETQALMPLLRSDLYEICRAMAKGALSNLSVEWSPEVTVAVVLVNEAYPSAKLEKDVEVKGLGGARRVTPYVYSARGEVTSGGRAVTCVGRASTMGEARTLAYTAADAITFPTKDCRSDIGIAFM